MDAYLNELTAGLPDSGQLARIVVRMLAAALFVITRLEWGMDSADMSRVIQGLVTGIGFIGGGAILKLAQQREVEGLTTAAGLWMTCAVGIAAGLGRLGAAALGVVLTVIILGVVGAVTHRLEMKKEAKGKPRK
jgi:putative Mg2+ transporter-C (MgtC) family protein